MNEEELFRKYRETHDVALRNQIVEKYLYIAAVLAKKFVGRGVEYDDLYQVASLALIKGVDRFDERKGLRFSTFITPTITGEIKNYFRDRSRLVHLPRKVSELRVSIKHASEAFFAEQGRKPTAKELAQQLGVSEEEVLRASDAGGVVSLDVPVDREGEGMSLHDVLPADGDIFEKVEDRDALEAALRRAGAGTYRIRIIHGYHGGTVLRDMVRREYGAHPRVKRVEGGFDPGITDLVLREF